MNDSLRVGVVGVGHLGNHHARTYTQLPGVHLVGVVDPDPDRAKKIASEYGCMAWSNLSDLIGKVDAVSVVTPTATHHDVAIPLLQAGIHLLLEKPMAATLPEADAILAEARARNVILQIGHIERFSPGFRHIKAATRNPRYIECQRLGPFAERGIDVHVILDLMIHDIDLVLTLIGETPVEIRAVGAAVLTPHIDMANARLAFANGAVANLTASRVSPTRLRSLRLFEDHAYFSLDSLTQELLIARRGAAESGGSRPSITTEKIAIERQDALHAELSSFVSAVRTRSQPEVTGQDGRRAMEIAMEIERIIRQIVPAS
jgi:predicted dehydrogenase